MRNLVLQSSLYAYTIDEGKESTVEILRSPTWIPRINRHNKHLASVLFDGKQI